MERNGCRFKDVKELREARGLTQVKFSKLIGLAQTTISLNERGRPSAAYILAVAKALKITVEELLEDEIS